MIPTSPATTSTSSPPAATSRRVALGAPVAPCGRLFEALRRRRHDGVRRWRARAQGRSCPGAARPVFHRLRSSRRRGDGRGGRGDVWPAMAPGSRGRAVTGQRSLRCGDAGGPTRSMRTVRRADMDSASVAERAERACAHQRARPFAPSPSTTAIRAVDAAWRGVCHALGTGRGVDVESPPRPEQGPWTRSAATAVCTRPSGVRRRPSVGAHPVLQRHGT